MEYVKPSLTLAALCLMMLWALPLRAGGDGLTALLRSMAKILIGMAAANAAFRRELLAAFRTAWRAGVAGWREARTA